MAKELYIERNFSEGSMSIVNRANAIIKEYQAQGYALTLRQLYYQFVARAVIANKQTEYKRLGSIINDARLAGLIDWEAIEDRTRNLERLAHWSTPADILSACADQYREDVWKDQPLRIEVWVEKEALIGVIERICDKHQVPYFACRGNVSQSESWRAGKRFLEHFESTGKETLVLHFGDHDPNGIDMTRDNDDRLAMFSAGHCEVRRLALNMDQIRKYNPPPNPVKLTDSRAQGYIARFGTESWELDALEPKVIAALIEREILKEMDSDLMEESKAKVQSERDRISDVAARWEDENG